MGEKERKEKELKTIKNKKSVEEKGGEGKSEKISSDKDGLERFK